MKNRSPIAVCLLPFVTFGIYFIYWQVVTKDELNKLGNDIPTAWFLIIPFVNLWWLWKYSEAVEKVTGGKTSGVLAFVLLVLLGSIGAAIIQDSFNKTASATPADTVPSTPVESAPDTPVPPAPTA